jgi:hypothetical protein
VKDKAAWPADATGTSCTKGCGPDNIGLKTCLKVGGDGGVENAMCSKCVFPNPFPACYAPPAASAAEPADCPSGVVGKTTCAMPCPSSSQVSPTGICLELDSVAKSGGDATKTDGCVCTLAVGPTSPQWTCATWDTTNNTWGI